MKLFNKIHLKKNHAGAVGIIGGTYGPTAIFTASKTKKEAEKAHIEQKKFLEYAAKQIKPNNHNFSEIGDYLMEQYNAIPYSLSEKQLEILKINVIINNFREVLELPVPLDENPTKKQIKRYFEEDTSFEQARNYPAENLGLNMRAYQIPCDSTEEVIVEIEMKSEYLCIQNGTDKLANHLLFWQGVTQEDIDNKTPRFIAFAYAMKATQKINYSL